MPPRFSILVPTFNREVLLRETIESVLSQSFKDYELIVIDDGSTDRTWDLLQTYGPRICALRQANQGPEVARNLGAAHASGEYLALLDSDDLLFPHALATYDRVIRACAAPALIIGAIKYFRHGQPWLTEAGPQDIVEVWKYGDYLSKDVGVALSSSNILVRKSVFDQGGGLRTSTPATFMVDTFATVLRFGTYGPCAILKRPNTVAYRIHGANTIHNVEAMIGAMLSLVEGEKLGQYPGGRARRFARFACLGGMSLCWVRHALQARRPGLAFKLLVHSGPMVVAGALKKLRSRLRPATPAIRIN